MRQEQRLKMSPQLFQSIQLMTLPVQELSQRIHDEVEKNPALEILSEKPLSSLSGEEPSGEADYFENTSDPGYSPQLASEKSDNKRQFLEGAISRPESLHEHLLWQLQLEILTPQQMKVGELLINNLNEDGFHIEDPETLVKSNELDILYSVMEIIQEFEPEGTCTADVHESLIVQSQVLEGAPKELSVILTEHWNLLEKGKIDELIKATGFNSWDITHALDYLKDKLSPFPGRKFSQESATLVVPDLMLRTREGEFILVLNDEEIPVLGVDSLFQQLMKNKEDRKAKQFVTSRVKDAQFFIRSIQQRNDTLLKVARTIIEFQRDFFYKGPKYLVPLTLKDIAEEVGVHEATVSRLTNGKYLQTEKGIYELKYFFSNSVGTSSGNPSRYSKEGVKEIIREILEENTSGKKLSDQKISDILQTRGIKVARRTVAKYRGELDISSSYSRQ